MREGREKERRCTETFKGIQIEVRPLTRIPPNLEEIFPSYEIPLNQSYHPNAVKGKFSTRIQFLYISYKYIPLTDLSPTALLNYYDIFNVSGKQVL